MGACEVFQNQSSSRNAFLTRHPSFNIFALTQNSQLKQVQHSLNILDESVLQQWTQCLKAIRNPDSPYQNLWLPYKKKYSTSGIFCNDSGRLQLIFELCQESLETRLKKYRLNKNKMRQGQIWYLLYILAKVGRYFQKLGRSIGNICPQNILYNSSSEIKIVSSISYPFLNSQLQFIQEQGSQTISSSFQTIQTYLAPEQMNNINKCQKGLVNMSQTFAVGMTILQCTTFENLEKLYTITNNKTTLSQNKIYSLILKAENKYSPMLINYIYQMLEWQPKKRTKLSDIYKSLEKYQNQILKGIFSGDNSSSLITLKMSLTLENKVSLFKTSQVSQINKENQSSNISNRYENPYSYHEHRSSKSSLKFTNA